VEETKPNWFVKENIKFLGNQVHFCDQNLSYASSLRKRHFESSKQGETNSRNGDATKTINPKNANPATTCVLCRKSDALEWPSLFLQGPLS